MSRIDLSETNIPSLEAVMDDPSSGDKLRTKLLFIRMHSECANYGFIAKCVKLHSYTITN